MALNYIRPEKTSVIDESDFNSLANIYANVLLDGKGLKIDVEGTVIPTGTTAKGYTVQEATDIAMHVVNTFVQLRKANASGTEHVDLTLTDRSRNKLLNKYKDEIKTIADSLVKTTDQDARAHVLDKTFTYLIDLSTKFSVFKNNQEVEGAYSVAVGLINSYQEDVLDQPGLDALYQFKEQLLRSRSAFTADGKKQLKLPISEWTDDLSAARRGFFIDSLANHINEFFIKQKELGGADDKRHFIIEERGVNFSGEEEVDEEKSVSEEEVVQAEQSPDNLDGVSMLDTDLSFDNIEDAKLPLQVENQLRGLGQLSEEEEDAQLERRLHALQGDEADSAV